MARGRGVVHTVRMDKGRNKPDRTLLVILGVVGALVVVALAVVFTRGEPPLLDESTPQGVVQRYAAAVIEGDEEAASAYLADGAGDCDAFEGTGIGNLRVTLVSATERGDTADVRVVVTVAQDGGPFGASEYDSEGNFDLVRDNGGWLIEGVPWELTICANQGATK